MKVGVALHKMWVLRECFLPSFLNSASLPLAQPFTDHTEQALCSAKKVNQENLVS
jgi:hypothetical protein